MSQTQDDAHVDEGDLVTDSEDDAMFLSDSESDADMDEDGAGDKSDIDDGVEEGDDDDEGAAGGGADDEEGAEPRSTTYIPNEENAMDPEELEYDESAYVMYHKAECGYPCLSFGSFKTNN